MLVGTALPAGYAPADLQSAYNVVSAANSTSAKFTRTIAIVDAYDDPYAEQDLATYRQRYGLPACSSAARCFRKVDQRGQTNYPFADTGWALEMSLDLDVASAMCPNCKLLLVEADSDAISDLAVAVTTAVSLGATVVSNSYGAMEWAGETQYESYFSHPGVPITASAGDNGYGVSYPAASQFVTAVGGTSLVRSRPGTSGRPWGESAWSGSGSGCSAYIGRPQWQTGTGCTTRSVADVAAVADPGTGVAVYDSFNQGGWQELGGTSASAPLVAAVYALGATAPGQGAFAVWSRSAFLWDIVGGSNGSCNPARLCHAGAGYDGPTGLGTPNGAAGF
jgi:subtilase family serine protease